MHHPIAWCRDGVRFYLFPSLSVIICSSHFSSFFRWLSPALPILLSDETPLTKTGPISNDELSWIGAMNSVGAIVGTFVTGIMSAYMGSKRAMTFVAYPAIAFWLLVYFGDSFYHILLARFATGLTGRIAHFTISWYLSIIAIFVQVAACSLVLCSMYQKYPIQGKCAAHCLIRICNHFPNFRIRGRLGSITPLARNTGILIAYIAGWIVKYEYRPYIFIFIPIIYLIWVYFLPATPQHYLKKSDFKVSSFIEWKISTHFQNITHL